MSGLLSACACLLFAAAATWDLRRRRIPNVVPLALAALFAAGALAGTVGPAAPWTHAVVGGALLTAGFVLWLAGMFGASDGKLLAVAGLWIGPLDLSLYLFGFALAAFALCLVAMLPVAAGRRMRAELPFAVAIAPPAVAVLAQRVLSLQG